MSSGVTRVDLRPDRDLLDPHFESYKLSLESPPVFGASLSSASSSGLSSGTLSALQPDDAQFSYLHAKLFSNTSNLLVGDSNNPELVFLLDPSSAGSVWQVLHSQSGPPELIKIFQPPDSPSSGKSGDYNPTLCFAGHDLAVIADGRGQMHVAATGDRSAASKRQWEAVFSSGDGICGRGQPFSVASVALNEAGDKKELHCLVNYVEEKEKVDGLKANKTPRGTNYVNVVEWMCLAQSGSCWGLDRLRRYAMFGSADYLQLEKGGEGFYVATEKPFVKIYDSAGGDEEEDTEQMVEKSSTSDEKPPFYWYQGVEDIAVWVPLPGGRDAGWTKRDIKVTLRPREMTVTLKGEKAFGGQLWNVLDSDSMTWTMQGEKLEITVCKANEGLVWQRFLSDPDSDGLELGRAEDVDDAIAQAAGRDEGEAPEKMEPGEDGQPPAAFNSEELEACDALPVDSFALYAVGDAGVTVRADLSGHQHLMNLRCVPDLPGAVCLRHDVDGLVWQPQRDTDGTTRFVHVGTFPALGYVQASKEQRRFSAAPASMGYAALAEASRRVFLYRQPSAIPSEFDLRNRKSGRRVSQVAKQQVITLEEEGGDDGQRRMQVQGLAATDGSIVVLTSKSIFCIPIG